MNLPLLCSAVKGGVNATVKSLLLLEFTSTRPFVNSFEAPVLAPLPLIMGEIELRKIMMESLSPHLLADAAGMEMSIRAS